MIYDTLETIPITIFFKIAETGDFRLLSDTETDLNILESIWNKLFKQHEVEQSSIDSEKIFNIHKEISALECDQKFILGAVYSLGFEYDEELVEMVRKKRYQLRTDNSENYYNDLEFIQRAAESINLKIANFKSLLPKEETEEKKPSFKKFSIYDTMASYTRIMGFDFNYDTISYMKFYAVQKQVHLKIESEIKHITKK